MGEIKKSTQAKKMCVSNNLFFNAKMRGKMLSLLV